MAQLTDKERSEYVRGLFSGIAQHYDLMNCLMTGGQDIRWRRDVIRRAGLSPQARLLDIGAGTGDLAREAKRQQPEARVVAADFTLEMMRVGQRNGFITNWSAVDALSLPFPSNSFDAVVLGFLMRNVVSVERALLEQFRVLKDGGRIVILDTTRPRRNLLTPLIWAHMHLVIPLVGGLLTGIREAYTYLPDSTENFLLAEQLASRMTTAGFKRVRFQRRMFGAVAIHWGEK
ncbi:MAG: ubiquinone/menaquinone biosynthesis methyltransferase [Chloroflexota bacterium]